MDQVLLSPEWDGSRYLHVSPKPYLSAFHEVNCSFNQTCWTIKQYDDPRIEPRAIRLGVPIALFHAEIEAFLSADAENDTAESTFQSTAIVFIEGQEASNAIGRAFSLDLPIPTVSAPPPPQAPVLSLPIPNLPKPAVIVKAPRAMLQLPTPIFDTPLVEETSNVLCLPNAGQSPGFNFPAPVHASVDIPFPTIDLAIPTIQIPIPTIDIAIPSLEEGILSIPIPSLSVSGGDSARSPTSKRPPSRPPRPKRSEDGWGADSNSHSAPNLAINGPAKDSGDSLFMPTAASQSQFIKIPEAPTADSFLARTVSGVDCGGMYMSYGARRGVNPNRDSRNKAMQMDHAKLAQMLANLQAQRETPFGATVNSAFSGTQEEDVGLANGGQMKEDEALQINRKMLNFVRNLHILDTEQVGMHGAVYLVHLSKQKTTYRMNDDLDVGSNSLWLIEAPDASIGGPVAFRKSYRLKHTATQRYFSITTDSKQGRNLKMTKHSDEDSLFEFLPWDPGQEFVGATESYFLLKHVSTDLHIHFVTETNPSTIRRAGGHLVTQIGLSERLFYEDIFCCVCKPAAALQLKLNVVSCNIHLLKEYIAAFKASRREGAPDSIQGAISSARGALTKLITFCTMSDDANPLTREGVPIQKHQEILMDQNVHHIVIQMLQVTLFQQLDPNSTAEHPLTHNKIKFLCTLCYRLLRLMIKGTINYALRLSQYIPFMQSQVSLGIGVADTIMEVFKDNRVLLEQMTEDVLDCFVQLAQKRYSRYLIFLAELCICEEVGIPKNQRIICNRLLTQRRGNLLLPMRMYDDEVEVMVSQKQNGHDASASPRSVGQLPDEPSRPSSKEGVSLPHCGSAKTLRRVQKAAQHVTTINSFCKKSVLFDDAERKSKDKPKTEDRWVPLQVFCKYESAGSVSFLEIMLNLFWKLCIGNNIETIQVVRQFITKEMMRCVLGSESTLPNNIKYHFYKIATHVHLHVPHPSRNLNKTIKLWQSLGKTFVSRPENDSFLEDVKVVSLKFLQEMDFYNADKDLCMLCKAILEMWESIVTNQWCTLSQLKQLLECTVKLLQVPQDAKKSELLEKAKKGAESIFLYTESTLVVMQCKNVILTIINAFIDQHQADTLDLLMSSFRTAVQTQGADNYLKKDSRPMVTLLAGMEGTLNESSLRSPDPKAPSNPPEPEPPKAFLEQPLSRMESMSPRRASTFTPMGRTGTFYNRPQPRARIRRKLALSKTAREAATMLDVQWMVGVLMDLTLYEYEPLSKAAVELLFRMYSFKGEVRELMSQQLLLFDDQSETFWRETSTKVSTLKELVHVRMLPDEVVRAKQIIQGFTNSLMSQMEPNGIVQEMGEPGKDLLGSSFLGAEYSTNSLYPGSPLSGTESMSPVRMTIRRTAASFAFKLNSSDLARFMINQDILRHTHVHGLILELIMMPFSDELWEKDVKELLVECYLFLEFFCDDNSQNQCVLAEHDNLFLRHISFDIGADEVLMKIYSKNYDLCTNISMELISTFFTLWDRKQTEMRYLEFLCDVTVVGGLPIARTQTLVMNALVDQQSDVLQAYMDINGTYHIDDQRKVAAVVHLMAQCCVGLNSSTEAPAQGLLSLDQTLKVLALSEEDSPLPLMFQLPFVTFMREVYVVKEEQGQLPPGESAPNTDLWFCSQNWFFVVSQFKRTLQAFNESSGFGDLPLGTEEDYATFIFDGIVPCMSDFFETCEAEPKAIEKVTVKLWEATSELVDELIMIMNHEERIPNYPLLGMKTLEKCLSLAAKVRLPTVANLDDNIHRCASLIELVAMKDRPELSKFAQIRMALEVFQLCMWEPDTMVGVDDAVTFTTLMMEYLDEADLNVYVMEKLVSKMKEGMELPQTTKVEMLKLFGNLIKYAPDKQFMQVRMASSKEKVGFGLTPLMTMIAEGGDEVAAYEAIYFGISLFEGGNTVAQDAIMQWFGEADECFFDSMVEKLRNAVQALKDRQREKAFFQEQLFHNDEEKEAYGEVLERKRDVKQIQAVLRLLQLFCEGHFTPLQNYIRQQVDNHHSYNMVTEVVVFMKEVLGLGMDNTLMKIAVQSFNTLTEFCQGPCPENQEALVACNVCQEVNVVFQPLGVAIDPTLVFELRSVAVVMLLSLLEGHNDRRRPNDMVHSLEFHAMARILDDMWEEVATFVGADNGLDEDQEQQLDNTFNIFVLMHVLQIMSGDEALEDILKGCNGASELRAMLCVLEIARENSLERVYFRKPTICKTLPQNARDKIIDTVSRQSPNAKLADFFQQAQELILLMEHRHQCQRFLLSRFPAPDPVAHDAQWWEKLEYSARFHLRKHVISAIPHGGFTFPLGMFILLTYNSLLMYTYQQGEEHPEWSDVLLKLLAFISLIKNIMAHTFAVLLEPPGEQPQKNIFQWLVSIPVLLWMPNPNDGLWRVMLSAMAVFYNPLILTLDLLNIVNMFPLLTSVLQSVTVNARSLLLTAILCAIVIYLFGLVGFVLFPEDFRDPEGYQLCTTIWQCFIISLTKGIRADGGIGGLLSSRTWGQPYHYARLLFDFTFYVVVIVCLLNIVFGIIIDTFGQLRREREFIQEDTRKNCFICGLDSNTFDRQVDGGFSRHVIEDHNMWNYLYFLHHLRIKPKDDFTGQESYVWDKIQTKDISFFPLNALVLQDKEMHDQEDSLAAKKQQRMDRLAQRVQQIEAVFSTRIESIEKQMTDKLGEICVTMKTARQNAQLLQEENDSARRHNLAPPALLPATISQASSPTSKQMRGRRGSLKDL